MWLNPRGADMSDEWGPLIKHDGGEGPDFGDGRGFIAFFDDPALVVPPEGGEIEPDHPCWLWRWRLARKGWFQWGRKRVCDDPAYSPIVFYRIRRPRGIAVVLGLLVNLPDTPPDGGSEVVPIKAKPKLHKVKT